MLVALGLRPDARKEIIDFRLAAGESTTQWEAFLCDLYRRGLKGEGLELIAVDGGKGLLAALPMVYPAIPVQRCWAHKIRNILNKVKAAEQQAVKLDLHKFLIAENLVAARQSAGRFARRLQEPYPKAVAGLRGDLEELLSVFRYAELNWRKAARTTNAIERRGPKRSAGAPAPWASSPTAPRSSASSSPSSPMRTATRESAPLSC